LKTHATEAHRVSDGEAVRRAAVHVALLRYLAKHPHASDALVGICAWWLPEEGVNEEMSVVEEVLEGLVNRGLIRRHELADGTRIYGSARARRNGA
jgi:hypothetical protein